MPHLLLILFERNRDPPVTVGVGALIDGAPVGFVSDHILTATLPPATACGVLLVRLPAEEDDERDKKDVGTNEHNVVHGSLLSRRELSSKLKGTSCP